jgi:hypothetical protein
MSGIRIWKAKLDYLVVRQRDMEKYGSACREREGSVQIQVCMPAAGWAGSKTRGELDYLVVRQTDKHKPRFHAAVG